MSKTKTPEFHCKTCAYPISNMREWFICPLHSHSVSEEVFKDLLPPEEITEIKNQTKKEIQAYEYELKLRAKWRS